MSTDAEGEKATFQTRGLACVAEAVQNLTDVSEAAIAEIMDPCVFASAVDSLSTKGTRPPQWHDACTIIRAVMDAHSINKLPGDHRTVLALVAACKAEESAASAFRVLTGLESAYLDKTRLRSLASSAWRHMHLRDVVIAALCFVFVHLGADTIESMSEAGWLEFAVEASRAYPGDEDVQEGVIEVFSEATSEEYFPCQRRPDCRRPEDSAGCRTTRPRGCLACRMRGAFGNGHDVREAALAAGVEPYLVATVM